MTRSPCDDTCVSWRPAQAVSGYQFKVKVKGDGQECPSHTGCSFVTDKLPPPCNARVGRTLLSAAVDLAFERGAVSSA
jgi:hypothetical protein